MRVLKILGAVAVINVLARLLGFAREVVIGYQYGTSTVADAIITAFTIPNFIYIVLGGAVTTAFISVYSKLGEEKKQSFIQTVFTALVLLVGVVTAVFIIFSKQWIGLFFSDLAPEELTLTSNLFTWMAPATFFLVIAMWLSGVLNVHEKYRITATSTFVFNAGFLLIAVALTPLLQEFSYGLGASLGAFFMMVLLIYVIRKQGIMSFSFSWGAPDEMKRLLKLSLPILFGGATLQFYVFIQRIYATQLSDGVVASLNYASKMTQFPQAVLMTAVTTVIYPMLAKSANEETNETLGVLYRKGVKWLALLLLPVTLLVMFYAQEIIQIIFEYGNFNEDSTKQTYPLLRILALSMFGLAMNMYITRFFYAKENSYIPVIFNVLSVFGVNVLVITLFIDTLGASAIAWGTVAGTAINTVILMILAYKKYRLAISLKNEGIKLIGLTAFIALTVWLSTLLSIGMPFVDLLIGGVVYLISLFVGIFLFNFKEEKQMIQKRLPF